MGEIYIVDHFYFSSSYTINSQLRIQFTIINSESNSLD